MRPALLVTRPQPDADRLAGYLDALGIEPVLAPMLTARASGEPVPNPEGFAALAATSANAFRFLARRGLADRFTHLPVFAVGDQTALEAERAGFANVTIAAGTLSDLAHTIIQNPPPGPIFYPAAHHRSGDLAGLLAGRGIKVSTHVLYEMIAVERFPSGIADKLHGGNIAGALFYSRRTAEVFASLCAGDNFAPVRSGLEALCLSENCAAPLIERRFVRISLADYPSGEAMMTLALAFAREQIKA